MDNATLTKHAEAILRAAGMSEGAIMLVLDAGPLTSEAILTALRAAVEDGAERAAEAASQTASDEAADFCITTLASMLGNPDYEQADGSEEWEGDVAGTIFNVLRAADVLDEEHRVATHSAPKWMPIETCPAHDKFIGGITIRDIKTGEEWFEQHIIWLDDETGDVHPDADQGHQLDSYDVWMPLPAAPTTISATVGGGA